MIAKLTTDFPPFIEELFEKMVIPGKGNGFAISYEIANTKTCVALGGAENGAIAVKRRGDPCTKEYRKQISREEFEKLSRVLVSNFKKSGFLGAEDILDGETYLVKWFDGE